KTRRPCGVERPETPGGPGAHAAALFDAPSAAEVIHARYQRRGDAMTHQLTRTSFLIPTVAVTILVTSAMPAPARPEPPAAKKDEPPKEAGHDDGERIVKRLDVEVRTDDGWAKVERIAKPLLLYSDPTRDNDRGSVWGWGDKGRPVALIELFQNPDDRSRWTFALCNTSGRKLRATMDGRPWWQENSSASELKDFPATPPAPP